MTTRGSLWDFAEAADLRNTPHASLKTLVRAFTAQAHDRGVVFRVGETDRQYDTKRAIKLIREYATHNSNRGSHRMLVSMLGKRKNRDKPIVISVGVMMHLVSWRIRQK